MTADLARDAASLPADVCARRTCIHGAECHYDGTGACGDCACPAFVAPPAPSPEVGA